MPANTEHPVTIKPGAAFGEAPISSEAIADRLPSGAVRMRSERAAAPVEFD